jgi:hypothetical protein
MYGNVTSDVEVPVKIIIKGARRNFRRSTVLKEASRTNNRIAFYSAFFVLRLLSGHKGQRSPVQWVLNCYTARTNEHIHIPYSALKIETAAASTGCS